MKSFNEIYQEVYMECKDVLENSRQEALKENIKSVVIILITTIFFTLITQNTFAIIIGVFAYIIYFGFNRKNTRYNNLFKEKVIAKFVNAYSSSLNYHANRGIGPSVYKQGEFEPFNVFYSEDAIIGTFEDGNSISMSEVKAIRESRDSDGDKTRVIVFHGMFAEVKLPKLVLANIKIRRDQFLLEGRNKVEMDSGEFEKKFTVFSTDSIIAMQLLTSDIMQMFIDFKEKNRITPELTIKADRMYIRFNTGDVFEANLTKESLDFDTLLRYYNIITFTLKLTEEMAKNINETEL